MSTLFSVSAAPLALAIALMPTIAVWSARRTRDNQPTSGLTQQRLLIAAAVGFLLAPLTGAVITPDWSPVSMMLITAPLWACSAWAGVFTVLTMNGRSIRASALAAAAVALLAPFLGVLRAL